jgi:uncharacterized membrane protein
MESASAPRGPGIRGRDPAATLSLARPEAVIARNVNDLHASQMTIGEKLADRLAAVAGSWRFILGFLAMIATWVAINSLVLLNQSWDPYPFILLNLLLSLVAGLQAPVIMMSQHRQEDRDRIRAEHDYEVNVKAELEIEELHLKMDLLRETQWAELVEMQQRQIALLERQLEMLRSFTGNTGKAEAPASAQ